MINFQLHIIAYIRIIAFEIFHHQGKAIGSAMYWDSEAPLRFHVIEKSTGKRLQCTKYYHYQHHNGNQRLQCITTIIITITITMIIM